MTANSSPDFLLFAQHGWADTGNDINRLAQALATPKTLITAPSLGMIKTFIKIDLLVKKLEQIVFAILQNHPQTPMKIMGHSMGGLIWLELLERHPEWWHQVHSLVVIGSPIGGSDVARIIDPFNWGIGTAKDLGKNRRPLAEKIAQQIPTLSIASNLDRGSDGLVTVENTKFAYSQFVLVSGIPHAALKCHSSLVPIIQEFWANPQINQPSDPDIATQLIRLLQAIPGMTDADYKQVMRSQIIKRFPGGINLRTWKNAVGVNHVFVTDEAEQCLYAGYVGWLHAAEFHQTIATITQEMSS
jgi:hypothetical protein